MKTVEISKARFEALEDAAMYIIACDNKECEDYIEWCEENDLNPFKIRGKEQKNHPYAIALFGLGLKFPKG